MAKLEYGPYVTCNMEAIKKSRFCSCCHCLKTFPATEVTEYWLDACPALKNTKKSFVVTGKSGICPRCGIDAVVPDFLIKSTMEDLKRWRKQGWEN